MSKIEDSFPVEKCKFSQRNVLLEIPRYKTLWDTQEREKQKPNSRDDQITANAVRGKTDYPIQREPLGLLKHYQEQWLTHIFYDITDLRRQKAPDTMNEDDRNCQILHRVMTNFSNFNINASYSKRFSIVRNQNESANLKSTQTYGSYSDFKTQCMTQIYAKYYTNESEETFLKSNECARITNDLDFDEKKSLPEKMITEKIDSTLDNSSNKTMLAAIALAEVCDKITDGEIFNAFILLSNFLTHPLNNLLSTAAIAVSFFNYKLTKLKKSSNNDEFIYTKSQLPKITYIAFEGFYSEITIDMLSSFSDNVQIIMIYDSKTGGPNVLNSRYGEQKDLHYRVKDAETNDKVLYVPLECASDKKSYFGEDFLLLFEDVILKSVRRFKPDLIVMSHSFNFTRNNKTPFQIDEKAFSQIVYNLCLTVNYKLIIFPFKLYASGLQVYDPRRHDNSERIEYIRNRFCEDYDRKYLSNCFVDSVEALAGLKTFKISATRSKNVKHFNPLYIKSLKAVQHHYKHHSYYHFLYVKYSNIMDLKLTYLMAHAKENKDSGNYTAMEEMKKLEIILAEPSKREITNQETQDAWMNLIREGKSRNLKNKIILLHKEFMDPNQKEYSLFIKYNGNRIPFLYDDDSQYIVDYTNKMLYFFNVKTQGVFRNFAFPIQETPGTGGGLETTLDSIPLNPDVETDTVILKTGICMMSSEDQLQDHKIFLFYGSKYSTKNFNDIDSTEVNWVQIYDPKSQRWNTVKHLPAHARHSVTACCFSFSQTFTFAYVFGGEVNNELKIQTKSGDIPHLYNIVDFYKITTDGKWEHIPIDKETLTQNQKPFVPFLYSYAFKSKQSEIVIFGGKKFEHSENERTFNVFTLSFGNGQPAEHHISSHKTYFLSHEMSNIADVSRNVMIDRAGSEGLRFHLLYPYGESRSAFATFKVDATDAEVIKPQKLDKVLEIFDVAEETGKAPKHFLYRDHDKDDYLVKATINIPLQTTYLIKFYFNTPEKKIALLRVFVSLLENTRNMVLNPERIRGIIKESAKDYGSKDYSSEVLTIFENFKEVKPLFEVPGENTTYLANLLANECQVTPEDLHRLQSVTTGVSNNPPQSNARLETNPSISMVNTNPRGTTLGDLTRSIDPNKNAGRASYNTDLLPAPLTGQQMVLTMKDPSQSVQDSIRAVEPSQLQIPTQSNIQVLGMGQSGYQQIPPVYQQPVPLSTSQIMGNSYIAANVNQKMEIESKPVNIIPQPEFMPSKPKPASYHNLKDFIECYSSSALDGLKIHFNSSGSSISIFEKDNTFKCKLQFRVRAFDQDETVAFTEDSIYSVTIFGGCLIGYIDKTFQERSPKVYEAKKNAVLYANIERTLKSVDGDYGDLYLDTLYTLELDSGIFRRYLFADKSFIYIIGGNLFQKSLKKPVVPTDLCTMLEIKDTGIIEKKGSFPHKFYEYLMVQTDNAIYVIDGEKLGKVMIMNKIGNAWEDEFDVEGDTTEFLKDTVGFSTYATGFKFSEKQTEESFLVIAYKKWKPAKFYKLTIDADEKKLIFNKLKVKVTSEKEGNIKEYMYTGNESFITNTSRTIPDKLYVRHSRDGIPQLDEITFTI
jgi:hypothetical protein